MNTIAVIDDDTNINTMLKEILTKEGYRVIQGYSGSEALLLLEKEKPDLILLDLMLPGLTGEEVLPKIKDIPVIVLSAKVDVQNKINLLLGGAVDYMTKPFETGELLARIAIHLRRLQSSPDSSVYSFEDITLDAVSHEVKVSQVQVNLTKTEFAILKLLIQNSGKVIAKSVILDKISLDTPDCTERSLKQHISNLRKKLAEVNGKDYIEAVWGIGFKIKNDD